MRKAIAFPLFFALLLSLPLTTVLGQTQKGTITVTVEAEDGSRLPGVTVTAESDQTLSRRTVYTNEDGVATLAALDPAANYVVTTSLNDFSTSRNENVLVRAGINTDIRVQLAPSVSEELVVIADTPLVDVTSSVAGQEITLELTEALPTARSYQDYLQLVPGVQAAIGTSSNPASRSGVNYADFGGAVGASTDNFYFFDGINVTDPLTGTFGANLNTEIIQEQSVVTGGIPAEFVGASGLVSNVITKSGGNQFSGSVNYYFQDDSLVADDKHEENATFSTYDTAATLGGPILRDKAWFFLSYRNVNRQDDVISKDEGAGLLRTVENDADQVFAKATWAITQSDLVSGTYLSDPTDISGTRDNNNSNARDFASEQGGERFSLNYSKVFGAFVLDAAVSDHESDLNQISAIQAPRNTVAFRRGDAFTQAEEELGGFGSNNLQTRGSEAAKASLEALLDTSWGDHTIKGGVELSKTRVFRDLNLIDKTTYTSLSSRYLGDNVRARELEDGGFSSGAFTVGSNSDFGGLIRTINASANRDQLYALLDTDGNGTITQQEALDAIVYNASAGNPDGQINYNRTVQTVDGPQEVNSEATIAFLQDSWQWNRWSLNLGVRAEQWQHFASTGEEIFTFDWEYAPRISLSYDLKGDGRQRVSAYYGRYYDPVRNNMTQFAGSLSGRTLEEQVYIGGQWLTYRTRGGPTQQDGFFAPSTQTPYTDEYQLGYKIDLGR
ncbi:MAG: TonB-dependent receptor, partial [Acidobacteria bacterium]|nr:TonB-dependent receptor [Acidobacteriota bacterium]